MLETWIWGSGAVLASATLLWLVSLKLEDVSIVDTFWGLGFVLSAWIYAARGTGFAELASPQWVHLGLLTLWGFRLAIHIAVRHAKSGEEDRRYRKMREKAGAAFRYRSLVTIFLFQGLLIAVIGLPLLFGQAGERPAGWVWTDFLFLAVFAVGFLFEAGGDWQLTRFKADPDNEGKVLNSGLWRYTRHPNYFGDSVIWWSYWIFAIGSENGIYTFLCPILMTFFLLKVSGVSLLEKDIADRRPKYREYIERTPAFFPWFPSSGSSSEGGKG